MFSSFLQTTKTAIISPTTVIPNTSEGKALNGVDYGKVAAHVLVGSALAGLTIAASYIEKVDFGQWTALAVPALMGLYQLAVKWLRTHDTEV